MTDRISDEKLAAAIRQVSDVIERHGGRDEVPKLLGIELDALRELQERRKGDKCPHSDYGHYCENCSNWLTPLPDREPTP
jgi:hypothetical protein